MFSVTNIFFLSVVVNFWLYLAGWSSFITPCFDVTYYVVGMFQLLVICFSVLTEGKDFAVKNYVYDVKTLKLKNITIHWSRVFLVALIFLSAIENLYCSYSLFPFLSGIDTHVSVMPIVGPFMRAFTPIVYIFTFIDYKNTKSKLTILLAGLTILYLLLGSGSRLWSLISLAVTFIFILFFTKKDREPISWSSFVKGALVLLVCVIFAYVVGEKRINGTQYSTLIDYRGPFSGTKFGELLSWYYGYFPFSFNNLNLSLQNIIESNLFTSGKFFFVPFNSILKISYFLPYTEESLQNFVRVVSLGSASVPTAFCYFFADFGYFFFVTPLFYLFSYFAGRRFGGVIGNAFSSYMVTVFLFFSFIDIFQTGIPIYFLILIFICTKLFITKREAIRICERKMIL